MDPPHSPPESLRKRPIGQETYVQSPFRLRLGTDKWALYGTIDVIPTNILVSSKLQSRAVLSLELIIGFAIMPRLVFESVLIHPNKGPFNVTVAQSNPCFSSRVLGQDLKGQGRH